MVHNTLIDLKFFWNEYHEDIEDEDDQNNDGEELEDNWKIAWSPCHIENMNA